MTQSLAQKRAKDALEKIKSIEGKNHSWESNYLSYVKAIPASIIISGLGQAMAMVKAGANKKGDVRDGYGELYKHLNTWLRKKWSGTGQTDIINAIINGTEDDYIRAQAEAMEYLEWLKKFAMAFLKEGDSASSGGDDEPTST